MVCLSFFVSEDLNNSEEYWSTDFVMVRQRSWVLGGRPQWSCQHTHALSTAAAGPNTSCKPFPKSMSEETLGNWLFSSHPVSPGDQTQAIRVGSKCLSICRAISMAPLCLDHLNCQDLKAGCFKNTILCVHMLESMCRSQRTNCGSWFFPPLFRSQSSHSGLGLGAGAWDTLSHLTPPPPFALREPSSLCRYYFILARQSNTLFKRH